MVRVSVWVAIGERRERKGGEKKGLVGKIGRTQGRGGLGVRYQRQLTVKNKPLKGSV